MSFLLANLFLLAALAMPQELGEAIPDWTELDATTSDNGDYLVVLKTEQFTDVNGADAKICDAIRNEVGRWIRANMGLSGESYSLAMTDQQCKALICVDPVGGQRRSHTHHFRSGGEDRYRGHVQISIGKEFQSSLERSMHGSAIQQRLVWSLIVSTFALGGVFVAWTYIQGMRLTRGLYVRKIRWFVAALAVTLLTFCFLIWWLML